MHYPKARVLLFCIVLVALAGVLPVAAKDAPQAEPKVAAPAAAEQPAAVTANRCQRCGDGYCARSCENELTCPADCGATTKAATPKQAASAAAKTKSKAKQK